MKPVHIIIAAILYAPVRVVDKAFKLFLTTQGKTLADGLFQCLPADGGTQRVGKSPTDDLARVRIGYQVQVTDSPADKIYIICLLPTAGWQP